MGKFDSTSEHALKRQIDRTGLSPLMLEVEYYSSATLIDVTRKTYAAIKRDMLDIRVIGRQYIPVVFTVVEDIDAIGPEALLRYYACQGLRGLNIVEMRTLALQRPPKQVCFGLGQTVRGEYDTQIPYLVGGELALFPLHRVGSGHIVPATWAPDPLVLSLPAPH